MFLSWPWVYCFWGFVNNVSLALARDLDFAHHVYSERAFTRKRADSEYRGRSKIMYRSGASIKLQ